MRVIRYLPSILALTTFVSLAYILLTSTFRPYETSRGFPTTEYRPPPIVSLATPTPSSTPSPVFSIQPDTVPIQPNPVDENYLIGSSIEPSDQTPNASLVSDDQAGILLRYKRWNTEKIEMSADGLRGLILNRIPGTNRCASTFIEITKKGYVNNVGKYVSTDHFTFSGGGIVDCDFRL